MEAKISSGASGRPGAVAGFSVKAAIFVPSPGSITPSWLAWERGARIPATVPPARSAVSGARRFPSPPARIMVRMFGSAIRPVTVPNVRIALGSDERTALTDAVAEELAKRGHEVVLVGPPGGEDLGWVDVGRRVG